MAGFTRAPDPMLLPPPQQQIPWRKLAIAGAVIVILLSVAVRLRSPTDPAPPPTATGSAAAPQVITDPVNTGAAGTCADFTASPAEAVQADTTWTYTGLAQVPAAPEVGPAFTDPLRWCYAHTLGGAIFAAANFVGQQANADTALAATTLAVYLMADTPARQQVIRYAALVTPSPTTTAPPSSNRLSWLGYHVVTWSSTQVTVDMAHTWAGKITAAVYNLTWQAGDWKLIYPDGLQFTQRLLTGLDPTYWTAFGGGGAG